jgi:hypothetical protein
MAASIEKELQLFLGLDTLGNDLQPETVPHGQDSAHEAGSFLVGAEIPDEDTIDLEDTERKASEVAEG